MNITQLEYGKYYTCSEFDKINQNNIIGVITIGDDFNYIFGLLKNGKFHQIDKNYRIQNPLLDIYTEVEM